MFPDVYEEENSGNEPSAVGIVIADETPFNIEGIYPNRLLIAKYYRYKCLNHRFEYNNENAIHWFL